MSAIEHQPDKLPPGLRDRVLAASSLARPPGHWIGEPAPISQAEAFSRAADSLYGVLCALPEASWGMPVLRGLDVRGLVGHLIGVERDVHRCLSADPSVAGADHVGSTDPVAARQAGRPPADIRADWRRAVDQTLRLSASAGPAGRADGADTAGRTGTAGRADGAATAGRTGTAGRADGAATAGRADPAGRAGRANKAGRAGRADRIVALHGMRLPVADLLVVRAFELWTHENDIRRGTGLNPSVPDAATLRLMTELAAMLLPAGAARAGLRDELRLRLVLTGPGGGSWDVAIGNAGPASPALRIVTDAVGFCRLVANRISPADLELQTAGEAEMVATVLAGASMLALD